MINMPENDKKTNTDPEAPKEEKAPEEVPTPPEKPKPVKQFTPRQIRRRDSLERSKKLKPKLLKLYKHPGFPATMIEALTVERVMKNIGEDPKDEDMKRSVGLAWHQLYDAGKVANPRFYRPAESKTEQLPF